jgi:hypothetical protein
MLRREEHGEHPSTSRHIPHLLLLSGAMQKDWRPASIVSGRRSHHMKTDPGSSPVVSLSRLHQRRCRSEVACTTPRACTRSRKSTITIRLYRKGSAVFDIGAHVREKEGVHTRESEGLAKWGGVPEHFPRTKESASAPEPSTEYSQRVLMIKPDEINLSGERDKYPPSRYICTNAVFRAGNSPR